MPALVKETDIRIGRGLMAELAKHIGERDYLIVTDENVRPLHLSFFDDAHIVALTPGEQTKSLWEVEKLCRTFHERGLSRDGLIVAAGGGVVLDIAGFAAGIYKRGLDLAYAPTTLLAQADAAIGGKNGVNLDGLKNQLGLFQAPQWILIDPQTLLTLPQEEIANGLSEMVKHAAIADQRFFHFLELNADKLLSLDEATIDKAIATSVRIKAKIVEGDFFERNERRILNFGHTFGHALEAVLGLCHGQAVAKGMALAAKMSVARESLEKEAETRLNTLLQRLGFSLTIDAEPDAIMKALLADKKLIEGKLHFIFLSAIGQALEASLSKRELADGLSLSD